MASSAYQVHNINVPNLDNYDLQTSCRLASLLIIDSKSKNLITGFTENVGFKWSRYELQKTQHICNEEHSQFARRVTVSTTYIGGYLTYVWWFNIYIILLPK